MASFLDGITNGLSNLGSGLYNKVTNFPGAIRDTAGNIIDTTTEALGGETDRYLEELKVAEDAFYIQAEKAGMEGEDEFDRDAFREEYYKKSTEKATKAASALGKYKEQPQQKSQMMRSNAPKQGISGPKGYGRGEQAEPYEQMQRGMSTGDLEKMLLEAMRSNARMSIFQGGFKGGLL
jgi:hypothetical protein